MGAGYDEFRGISKNAVKEGFGMVPGHQPEAKACRTVGTGVS